MRDLFVDPETNDLRPQVMIVFYSIGLFILTMAVSVLIHALNNPDQIDFGIMR